MATIIISNEDITRVGYDFYDSADVCEFVKEKILGIRDMIRIPRFVLTSCGVFAYGFFSKDFMVGFYVFRDISVSGWKVRIFRPLVK